MLDSFGGASRSASIYAALGRVCALALVPVFGATMLVPTEAAACGGTFCDAGPTSMPVDQSGENILFVRDGQTIEAHIQIQYEGDAASFAWLVPMMAVPEVEVGSDPLFQALLGATVPTFVVSTRTEGDCGPPGGGLGCGDARGVDAGVGGEIDDGPMSGGPDVVARGFAGALEYAVLDGGTVDGVLAWLDDNGFAQDSEAAPILADYLQKGFVFVAFKLRGGAGIDEIHPVVLRYVGDEPCVPIRLTRIAATDDMGIRVFFLGERRVVPSNYRHVLLNWLRLDWINGGVDYDELVTLAADGEGADGHAFVTEFAGPSTGLATFGTTFADLDSSPLLDAPRGWVIGILESQGLLTCDEYSGCLPNHPLIGPLLEDYFPTPAGIDPASWWAMLRENTEADAPWPAAELVADFEERIVGPAEHAADLVAEHGYLTRMFTTMSPAEMTEDPTFAETDSLPDVSNFHNATIVRDCDGPIRVELDDGQHIELDDSRQMPAFADMPAAIAVEEIPTRGAPMVLFDHAAAVAEQRDEWNAGHEHEAGCACRMAPMRGDGVLLVGLFALGARGVRRRRAVR